MKGPKDSKKPGWGSPLLDLVYGAGSVDSKNLPESNPESPQLHLEPSPLEKLAFERKANDSKYMKIAVCAALYFVLILIWLPGPRHTITIPENFDNAHKPTRRRMITAVPPKPVKRISVSKPVARRIPMPDWSPEEPEPVVAEIPLPSPEAITTDDWGLDLPSDGIAGVEPRGGEVFRSGLDGVSAPVITYRASPMYPVEAVKVKLQGYVILEAILRKDGSIDKIKVLQNMAGGKFGFEREAIEALKKWKFEPGTYNGEPADIRMTLKISFVIY